MSDDAVEALGLLSMLLLIAAFVALFVHLSPEVGGLLPVTRIGDACVVPCMDLTGQSCYGPVPVPCPTDAGP